MVTILAKYSENCIILKGNAIQFTVLHLASIYNCSCWREGLHYKNVQETNWGSYVSYM